MWAKGRIKIDYFNVTSITKGRKRKASVECDKIYLLITSKLSLIFREYKTKDRRQFGVERKEGEVERGGGGGGD